MHGLNIQSTLVEFEEVGHSSNSGVIVTEPTLEERHLLGSIFMKVYIIMPTIIAGSK